MCSFIWDIFYMHTQSYIIFIHWFREWISAREIIFFYTILRARIYALISAFLKVLSKMPPNPYLLSKSWRIISFGEGPPLLFPGSSFIVLFTEDKSSSFPLWPFAPALPEMPFPILSISWFIVYLQFGSEEPLNSQGTSSTTLCKLWLVSYLPGSFFHCVYHKKRNKQNKKGCPSQSEWPDGKFYISNANTLLIWLVLCSMPKASHCSWQLERLNKYSLGKCAKECKTGTQNDFLISK